ncbi:hypothetical protein GCM10023325_17560 [Sphingomonas lutea]
MVSAPSATATAWAASDDLARRACYPMRFVTKVAIALVASNFLPPGKAGAQVVQHGTTFTCTPIAVWDGDGPIWCAEGQKVRIAGVAARELDGTCRSRQPCPPVKRSTRATGLCGCWAGPGASGPKATSVYPQAP